MCSRYTMTVDQHTIENRFGAKFITGHFEHYEPTYNAAPSQMLPIIRTHRPDTIELAKWGFVPEGWRSLEMRPQNNARLETANQKPMFHDSFRGRHCMVLADSFYEWRTLPSGKKQPYRIMLKTGEPFAMAGIYARSDDHQFGEAESATVTFAILTTTANEIIQPIHERMPVILPLGREKNWLPPNSSGMFVFPAFPSELMTAYPVSPKMSKASFNKSEAIAPFVPLTLNPVAM
jgi:putative SOS response-associated peptidase YedK